MNDLLKKKTMSRDTRQNIIIIAVYAAFFIVFSIISPYFAKPDNIITILVSATTLGLIGLAEGTCLLTGSFDMSVGQVATLAGIIWTALIAKAGWPVYVSFAIALLFGVISGIIAGIAVGYLQMPAWISTYALMQIWKGVGLLITDGEAIRMTKYKAFKWIGQAKLFGTGLTPMVLIMIAIYIIWYVLLKYTKLGRNLYVIGGNEEAARNVGVNVEMGRVFAYTVSGIFAALAGCLFASRSGSGQPVVGNLWAMQAISGTVIGGTAMTGGKMNVAMTFIGCVLVVTLQNGFNMAGLNTYYQYITTGVILVLAIFAQTERRK